MNEQEWKASSDPVAMLEAFGKKVSRRKLRLFCCACCRRVLHRMTSNRCRHAVETSERYADGQVGWVRFDLARLAAQFAMDCPADEAAWWAAHTFGLPSLAFGYSAVSISMNAAASAARATGPGERQIQAKLLRDIVGNPFRTPPAVPRSWLAWNDAVIPRLAKKACEGRSMPDGILDAAHLGVLADALEDAGCTDADILDHLRGSGPHVLGCFGLDATLGKS
jgi:hypothetical protein